MEFCTYCDMPIDDCNESQPVCHCCGEAFFVESSTFDNRFRSLALSLPTTANRQSPEIDVLRTPFRRDPHNIRFCRNLRQVCLHCGVEVSGSSFFH